jgi:pimeloyl-ACP methyl ester carboxylesterase
MDELELLNSQADSPFMHRLDLSHVAIAGHSLGGLVALLSLEQDPRFGAAILVDANIADAPVNQTERPVLVLAMGREQWSDNECRLWDDLRGPRLAVNLRGAEHLTASDAVWIAKPAIKTGIIGPEKTIEAIRDYIAAFLDANFHGKRFDPLLREPSSEFPDVTVTTQRQFLCSDTIKRSNADDAENR